MTFVSNAACGNRCHYSLHTQATYGSAAATCPTLPAEKVNPDASADPAAQPQSRRQGPARRLGTERASVHAFVFAVMLGAKCSFCLQVVGDLQRPGTQPGMGSSRPEPLRGRRGQAPLTTWLFAAAADEEAAGRRRLAGGSCPGAQQGPCTVLALYLHDLILTTKFQGRYCDCGRGK